MQFIRNIPMRVKLSILLIAVGLVSVVAVSAIAWFSTQAILREQAFAQLVSVRADRQSEIEHYFESLRDELHLLAEDNSVREGMKAFTAAYDDLDDVSISTQVNANVVDFYELQFLPTLERNLRQPLEAGRFMPRGDAGIHLQNWYIATNDNPIGSKQFLNKANDRSTYSDVHAQFHPFLRTFVNLFGYYDLFLIEPEQQTIVYSVYKEVDFATSLVQGAYATSNLAEVTASILQNPTRGVIQVSDFAPYDPSYQEPAAFFAIPLFDEDETVLGVLAIQVPIEEINEVMTSNAQWQEHGLGLTGETYLVGQDLLMRSLARQLIEDRIGYLNTLAAAGVEQRVRDNINNTNTSILQQEIATSSAENALAGETGVHIIENYRGESVLSAYAPIMVEGLNWVVIAEMGESEIMAPILQQQSFFLIAAAGLAVALVLISTLLANQFSRPLRRLYRATRQIEEGNLDIEEIPVQSKDEVGRLATAFNQMAVSLREQRAAMEATILENQRLLLSILPTPIAERFKQGEHNISDEIQAVAVLFAELHGIPELNLRFAQRQQAAELINQLSAQLEQAAHEHGVERQPTMSNQYVAVCGLNDDEDDYMQRIVDYAIHALQIVLAFNQTHNLTLALRIGIHAGAVLAALLDDNKFRFDLWGMTVEVADRMAAAGEDNVILVSHEVYSAVQSRYTFVPHQPVEVDGERQWRVWRLIAPDELQLPALTEDTRTSPTTLRARRWRIGRKRFGRTKVT